MISGIAVVVDGKLGTESSGTAKLNELVRSPTVARRHALKLGTSAPNRASRNRNIDVWSNRSDDTKPPRLNGEMTSIGTRKPKPMGPRMAGLPTCVGSGTAGAGTVLPGVPAGAVPDPPTPQVL